MTSINEIMETLSIISILKHPLLQFSSHVLVQPSGFSVCKVCLSSPAKLWKSWVYCLFHNILSRKVFFFRFTWFRQASSLHSYYVMVWCRQLLFVYLVQFAHMCTHRHYMLQATFTGRLYHFFDLIDPTSLFTSEVSRLVTWYVFE